jgi:putative membrane protein
MTTTMTSVTTPAITSPFFHLNAMLNTVAFLLLVAGYVAIRRRDLAMHRRLMATAFAVSIAFLMSYVTHHALYGDVRYPPMAPWRSVYLGVLVTHVVCSVVLVPMALRTLFLAWRQRYEEHRWWAKRTLPLWMYVSVTGVGVYAMLRAALGGAS